MVSINFGCTDKKRFRLIEITRNHLELLEVTKSVCSSLHFPNSGSLEFNVSGVESIELVEFYLERSLILFEWASIFEKFRSFLTIFRGFSKMTGS
jgi:hypothetical protein